ncbi:hypothetical protein [Streptomyces anandii]|uniref:hypothetical protein n=1 Tax=Streptomyces anandii TaxID=285454 RepID=UPI0035713EE2
MEGPDDLLDEFIQVGQYKAQRQDFLGATHTAQIAQLIADAHGLASPSTEAGVPLPIHSPPKDEAPQPSSAGLPIFFDRKFRPWRYSISHSELKLRSVEPASGSPEFIEVTFYGVIGMKLKTVYRPLTISHADPARAEEILRFSDVKESHSRHVHCLALRSDSGDGFVACLSYTIWSHKGDSDHAPSDTPREGSVLILRS